MSTTGTTNIGTTNIGTTNTEIGFKIGNFLITMDNSIENNQILIIKKNGVEVLAVSDQPIPPQTG
jgi:hypothetical protein